MTTTWTAGVVKLGADKPPPSLGATTLVAIEDYLGDDLVSTFELTWEGWTPERVAANRIKRWREAGTRYVRDSNQLTYWSADNHWQRLTLTDAHSDPGNLPGSSHSQPEETP